MNAPVPADFGTSALMSWLKAISLAATETGRSLARPIPRTRTNTVSAGHGAGARPDCFGRHMVYCVNKPRYLEVFARYPGDVSLPILGDRLSRCPSAKNPADRRQRLQGPTVGDRQFVRQLLRQHPAPPPIERPTERSRSQICSRLNRALSASPSRNRLQWLWIAQSTGLGLRL